jgi:NAD(P)-dependent dehydrogenase (short-subunit alcohol dehydrogenase family)
MSLSRRVAIITGGGRGIGRGIALKFAKEGCCPVVTDVLEGEGRRTVEELSEKGRDAVFIKCDVTDGSQVEEMVNQVIGKFGKVDILVNNAGITYPPKSITETTEEEWDRVLSVNLKGVFLCCKSVVPHMKEKRYGKIINISSLAAISPAAPMIHYSASKAGVLGLTLDLALEVAPFNICVNAILPGPICTSIFDDVLRALPPSVTKEDFFAELAKETVPMGRIGTPEDIARVALFLASEVSGYVTGDRIIVGGGAPLKNAMIFDNNISNATSAKPQKP